MNNDAVISAWGPPDNRSPFVATGICRSSSTSWCWTPGDLGRTLRVPVPLGLTKPRKMIWGKELRAIWCIDMRMINRNRAVDGTEVWKRGTAPGRASLGWNQCAAASETATLGRAMGLKDHYIYTRICKLEENWKGACFHMGDVLATSQCTKGGYEKVSEQPCITWGKKLPTFAAEVVLGKASQLQRSWST